MKRAIRVFCLLLTAAHSFTSAAFASAERMTLSEAMKWGLEKAPSLTAVRARRDAAQLTSTNAKVAFLPSLDFTSIQKVGYAEGTSRSSLQLSESLWSNGENWVTLKTTAFARDAADAAWVEAREKLAADLTASWVGFSRLDALSRIQEEKAALIEKQFGVMKRQFEQGLKTREDYQRIRAQLLRTQAELIGVRTQREQTRIAVLALIGIEKTDDNNLESLIPPPGPSASWKKFLEHAQADLNLNPTLKRIEAENAQSELAPLQARLNYWPNINLVADATVTRAGPLSATLGDNSTSSTQSWNAGLELSWNLWDWGTLRRSIQVADLERDSTQARLKQSELALRSEAQQTALNLGRLKEEALLQAEVAQMEEDNFRLVEENYRRGRSSYLDLITALRDRADARSRWNASYFETLQTHVKLLQLEGRAHAWLLAYDSTRP